MAELVSTFKERFSKAMSIREITPTDLKDKTGISLATISQYTSGYSKPKTERTNLIANALSVDPAWLMGFDVPMVRSDWTQIDSHFSGKEAPKEVYDKLMPNTNNYHGKQKKLNDVYIQLSQNNQRKVLLYSKNLLSNQQMEEELILNAAHDDEKCTPEERKAGDDLMMDDSEWE